MKATSTQSWELKVHNPPFQQAVALWDVTDSLSLISMHHIWAGGAGFDLAEWSTRAGFNIRAVAPVAVTGVSAMKIREVRWG